MLSCCQGARCVWPDLNRPLCLLSSSPCSRDPVVLMWVNGSKDDNSSLSRVPWGGVCCQVRPTVFRSQPLGRFVSLVGTLVEPVLADTRAVCRGAASAPQAGSSEPVLSECPQRMMGQAAQVDRRQSSAERMWAQEFHVLSKQQGLHL